MEKREKEEIVTGEHQQWPGTLKRAKHEPPDNLTRDPRETHTNPTRDSHEPHASAPKASGEPNTTLTRASCQPHQSLSRTSQRKQARTRIVFMYVIVFMNVFVVVFMRDRVRVTFRKLLGNVQKVFIRSC